jgi:hypothetical protein
VIAARLYKVKVDGSDITLLSDNKSFISVLLTIWLFLHNAELKEYLIKSDDKGRTQLLLI